MKFRNELSKNCHCWYFGFPLLGFTLSFVRIFKDQNVDGMPKGFYKAETDDSVLRGVRIGNFSANIFYFKD